MLSALWNWLTTTSFRPEILIALLIVFWACGLLISREILAWFFKTGDIKRDLKLLGRQMTELQGHLDRLTQMMVSPKAADEAIDVEPERPETPKNDRALFPLQRS